MSKYVNPLYGQAGNSSNPISREARIAWLENKITQMGHSPKKYELWHRELETLKHQPKHNKQKLPSKLQTYFGQHAAILKDKDSLKQCTDRDLETLQKLVHGEIMRRTLVRHKIKTQRALTIVQGYKEQGWMIEEKAISEVRRVIVDQNILKLNMSKKHAKQELSIKTIRAMWRGDARPWDRKHGLGPMRTGQFGYKPDINSHRLIYWLDPKQLLCHVIRQWHYQEQKKQELAEKEAERKRFHETTLKELEKRREQRARQVAQEWHARMAKANALWEKQIAQLEARKSKEQVAPSTYGNPGQPHGLYMPKEEVTGDIRHSVAFDTLKWIKEQEKKGRLEYAIKSGTTPTKDLPPGP